MRRSFSITTDRNAALVAVLSVVLASMLPCISLAQPMSYGSSDDPGEYIPGQWWLRNSHAELIGGFSLIGAQWRGAARATGTFVSQDVAGRFSGTARAGVFGFRNADSDELYDILRLVEYVKYAPRRARRLHMRAGPTDRLRLGTGHLVNFYSTQAAWDDRTIGGEIGLRGRFATVEAFTGDVFLDTISGLRVSILPLAWARPQILRSLEVGFSGVRDYGTPYDEDQKLTAYNGDVRFVAANIGEFLVVPYASVAWIENFGSGVAFGAHIGSENFIDLARLDLRFGIQQNSDQFVSGFFGSFYPVSNLTSAILKSEDLKDEDPVGAISGILLGDAKKSSDFVTEIRVLFFGDFEFWYYFKRNFGDQALSEYHLRFFLSTDRFKVSLSQDRGGLRGFFSLLNDLGDQTSLSFRTDYEINSLLWVFVNARYAYKNQNSSTTEDQRFSVERRFEPMTGIRLTF